MWNGMFFGTIAAIREYYPPPSPPIPSSSSSSRSSSRGSSSASSRRRVYDFATGLIAGIVATVINTPFDVCKTRLQCMTSAAGTAGAAGTAVAGGGGGGGGGGGVNVNKRVSLPWVLRYLRQLLQGEGFRACFKGLNARLYRAGPGSGLLLVSYEGLVKFLTLDK